MKVTYRKDEHYAAGVHSDSGAATWYVLLDGQTIGVAVRRSEWYGNITAGGHRGVHYYYWDFYRVGDNGRAIREPTGDYPRKGDSAFVKGGDTRQKIVARALEALGHIERGES